MRSLIFIAAVFSGACGQIANPVDGGADAAEDSGPIRPSFIQIAQASVESDAGVTSFVQGGAYGAEPAANPFQLIVRSSGPCTATQSRGYSAVIPLGTLSVQWSDQQLSVPAGAGGLYLVQMPGVTWPAGTEFHITNSGSPASIDALVMMPPPLVVTMPSADTPNPLPVLAANGLSVSWSPIASRFDVEVDIKSAFAQGGSTTFTNIYCTFRGDTGGGVVPPEVIALTPASAAATLYVSARSSTRVGVGGTAEGSLMIAADNISRLRQLALQ